jgi:hypothetical protein
MKIHYIEICNKSKLFRPNFKEKPSFFAEIGCNLQLFTICKQVGNQY